MQHIHQVYPVLGAERTAVTTAEVLSLMLDLNGLPGSSDGKQSYTIQDSVMRNVGKILAVPTGRL